MATENRPDDEDDQDPDAALRPLSFFFPEITPAEARTVDAETARIAERRVRVWALRRAKRTLQAIAEEVGCSVNTVWTDLNTMYDGMVRFVGLSARDHVVLVLQRYDRVEAEAWAGWHRSCGEAVETQVGKRDGGGGRNSSEQRVRKRARDGDPRFLAVAMQTADRVARLLGLLEREVESAAGGSGDRIAVGDAGRLLARLLARRAERPGGGGAGGGPPGGPAVDPQPRPPGGGLPDPGG